MLYKKNVWFNYEFSQNIIGIRIYKYIYKFINTVKI